eukprot:gnl/TRDRNA2_/TRDRNA2_94882_c0_seq1.p1 gnl/TRDRNA2_/TRDRNA2_94882_c0~~gnl/TRDRNA2_/TRDRNA2_94882_c0_seq1.p1  ORF type:complete len:338 (-),score=53.46 gnl/TRDRNA2_/TRDRNA2_94882_c0_seq1:44-1057(-)
MGQGNSASCQCTEPKCCKSEDIKIHEDPQVMVKVNSKAHGESSSYKDSPRFGSDTSETVLIYERTNLSLASSEPESPRDASELPPRPEDRTWRDEWRAVRTEELRLQGQEFMAKADHFEDNGPGSIKQMTKYLQKYIQWQVDAGWDREQAEAYTLLASCARAALGRALREHDPAYSACQHLVIEAINQRAKRLSVSAPDAYRNMSGMFGLVTEDPVWRTLADSSPSIVGTTFVTSAIVAGYTGLAQFPNEGGFHVGVSRGGNVHYEMQESDIVRFRSALGDKNGYHSLIQAAEGTYDLPPMCVVRLEEVKEAGEWEAYGLKIKRRLFVVSVTYGKTS